MNFRQPAGIIAGQEVFSRTRGVEPDEDITLAKLGDFSRTRGVEPFGLSNPSLRFHFSRTRGVEPG